MQKNNQVVKEQQEIILSRVLTISVHSLGSPVPTSQPVNKLLLRWQAGRAESIPALWLCPRMEACLIKVNNDYLLSSSS